MDPSWYCSVQHLWKELTRLLQGPHPLLDKNASKGSWPKQHHTTSTYKCHEWWKPLYGPIVKGFSLNVTHGRKINVC